MTQQQTDQSPTDARAARAGVDGACCTDQACTCAAPAIPSANQPTEAARELRALPCSERRDALEALVVKEFKASLLMTDVDELPLDGSFFDLGLTSLRATEVKQRLEQLLGCGINANVLFNRPTVNQLLTHLTEEALVDLFAAAPEQQVSASTAGGDGQWRDVLDDLYQR